MAVSRYWKLAKWTPASKRLVQAVGPGPSLGRCPRCLGPLRHLEDRQGRAYASCVVCGCIC